MSDSLEEKQNSTQRDAIIGWGLFGLVAFIGLTVMLGPWLYAQEWSGFGASTVPKDERYKTLWDWLQLLVVPLALASIALWFNWRTRKTDNELADKRRQYEEQIASDHLQEATLQAYLDQMTELLLKENLRDSTEGSEIRSIARVRTITTMRQLDGKRNRLLLAFLSESGLTKNQSGIVKLNNCDLSDVDLSGAILPGDDLSHNKMRGANLSKSVLIRTNLHKSDLQLANLQNACLVEADLSEADLSGADLTYTQLLNAKVTTEQLTQAKSLKSATMPDGTKHV